MSQPSNSVDGVLVIDKPVGPTSHDIVSASRRALGVDRVGHTGTLDPNASGVLPLVLGRATRLARHLTASDKEYDATVRFGRETDTYDSMGRVTRETGLAPSVEEIGAALAQFRGAIDQTPPPYSAKKVEGRRAYTRARQAIDVRLAPVPVVVHAIDLVSVDPPLARFRVVCSAGFYVRSLAHDLGRALGTGAILEALVRTRAGVFTLDRAMSFADLVGGPASRALERLVPLEALLPHLPAVTLTPHGGERVRHGQDLGPADLVGETTPADAVTIRLLSHDGRLLGLAERSKTPGFLHPGVVFG